MRSPFSCRRLLRRWLHGRSLAISHFWVLEEIRVRAPPGAIVRRAVEASWSAGGAMEIDEQDAEEAISDMLSSRIIQEVTPATLATIKRTVESPPGVLASPDLLVPELGEISPTLKGARIVVALYEDVFHENPSSEYVEHISPDGTGRIYARSRQEIAHGLFDHRDEIASFSDVGDPYSIGPWRSDWWYLNLSGWAVDFRCRKD